MRLSHSYSSLKMFDNCPKRYYHQRIAKEVREEPGPATVEGDRIHKELENYLKVGTPLSPGNKALQPMCDAIRADSSKTLAFEEEITVNKDLKQVGWWDSDAWMRSKLDVHVRSTSTAAVIDWKTGKRRPDFYQLELFATQVFLKYPDVQRVKSMFIWTKEVATDSETYHRKDLDKMVRSLVTKTNRIEEALETDTWPAKPSGLCGWCPCQEICEFALRRR